MPADQQRVESSTDVRPWQKPRDDRSTPKKCVWLRVALWKLTGIKDTSCLRKANATLLRYRMNGQGIDVELEHEGQTRLVFVVNRGKGWYALVLT